MKTNLHILFLILFCSTLAAQNPNRVKLRDLQAAPDTTGDYVIISVRDTATWKKITEYNGDTVIVWNPLTKQFGFTTKDNISTPLPDSLIYGKGDPDWVAVFSPNDSTIKAGNIRDDGVDITYALPEVAYGIDDTSTPDVGTYGYNSATGRFAYYNAGWRNLISGNVTQNYLMRADANGNAVNAGIVDDGSFLQWDRPVAFKSYTTAGLPTGVENRFLWNSTLKALGWHNGTRYAYAAESTQPTFTAGSVLFANSNGQITQNNSQFHWDNTNIRLGINAVPDFRFTVRYGAMDVNNNSLISIQANNPPSPYTNPVGIGWHLRKPASSVMNAFIGASKNGGGDSQGRLFFKVQTSATFADAMVIDGSAPAARVGILNITPAYTLDVNGDINSSTALKVQGVALWTSNGTNVYNNTTNIGIGTSTPDSLLTVRYTGFRLDKNNNSIISLQSNLGPITAYENPVGIGWNLLKASSGQLNAFIGASKNGGSDAQGRIYMRVQTSTTFQDALTIDGSTTQARVGILNITPTRTLDINGEVRITDLTTDTPTRIVGADADGDLGAITVGSGLFLSSGTLSTTGGYTGFTPAADATVGDNVASGDTLNILGGFGVNTSASGTTITVEADTSASGLATQYDVAQAALSAIDTFYLADGTMVVNNDTFPNYLTQDDYLPEVLNQQDVTIDANSNDLVINNPAIVDIDSRYISGTRWYLSDTYIHTGETDDYLSDLDIDGSLIIGGNYLADQFAGDAGLIYAYEINSGDIVFDDEYNNDPAPTVFDYVGFYVSVNSDRVLASQHVDEVMQVFSWNGTALVSTQRITPDGSDTGENWGRGMAAGEEYAIIGSYFDDPGAVSNAGSAYLYKWDDTADTLVYQHKILDPTPSANDEMGREIALKDSLALISGRLSGKKWIARIDYTLDTAIVTQELSGFNANFGDVSGAYIVAPVANGWRLYEYDWNADTVSLLQTVTEGGNISDISIDGTTIAVSYLDTIKVYDIISDQAVLNSRLVPFAGFTMPHCQISGNYIVAEVGALNRLYLYKRDNTTDIENGLRVLENGTEIARFQSDGVKIWDRYFLPTLAPSVTNNDRSIPVWQGDGNTSNAGWKLMQNVGAGENIFIEDNTNIDYKTITAGTNITLTPSATELQISATEKQSFTLQIYDGDTALPDSSTAAGGLILNKGFFRVPERMDGWDLNVSFGIFDFGTLTSSHTYSVSLTICDGSNANCMNGATANFTLSSERELSPATTFTVDANDIVRVAVTAPSGCDCGTESVNGLTATYTLTSN